MSTEHQQCTLPARGDLGWSFGTGLALLCLLELAAGAAVFAQSPDQRLPVLLEQVRSTPRVRRPAAAAIVPGRPLLLVAHERSGTLTLLNWQSGEMLFEWSGLHQPVDLLAVSDTRYLVADAGTGELLTLSLGGEQLSITERRQLGRGLSSLAVSPTGAAYAVAARWDRTIAIGGLSPGDVLQQPPVKLELNFEPGLVLFSPSGERLLVLDAFAGEVAVFDVGRRKLTGQVSLPGHNLRGATFLNEDRLLLTQQLLHADSPTTGENIAAGLVIENVIMEVDVLEVADGQTEIVPRHLRELGVPSQGAADPGSLVVTRSKLRAVALEGTAEVALLNEYNVVLSRLAVGERPVQLLLAAPRTTTAELSGNHETTAELLLVLNRHSETVAVVDLEAEHVVREISLGGLPAPTARERGERLFFAAEVSRFGWMSCQSCHRDGHSSDLLADTFGDETAGAPKRILSLLGGRDNNPWGWNGKFRTLHEQVHQTGHTTMRGPGFSARETNDLVAFLHTLAPPPPFRPAVDAQDVGLIASGQQLFENLGCGRCHVPPLTYTSDAVYDVGLQDELGLRKFNPPSLLGVGYRRRLLHDGRAEHLKAVFNEYGHQLKRELTTAELRALIRFLQSL